MTIAAAMMGSFGTLLASSMTMSYLSFTENWPVILPTWFPFTSVISYLCGMSTPNGRKFRASVTAAPRESIRARTSSVLASRIRQVSCSIEKSLSSTTMSSPVWASDSM